MFWDDLLPCYSDYRKRATYRDHVALLPAILVLDALSNLDAWSFIVQTTERIVCRSQVGF